MMHKLLKRISLPYKLLLLALVPLIFLIYFAYVIISEKNERLKVVNSIAERIDRSLYIADFANELHMERRYTTLFYFNKIADAELFAQYSRSDVKLDALRKKLGKDYPAFSSYTLIDRLNDHRNNTSHKKITFDQSLNFYTNAVLRLHNSTNISIENLPYMNGVSTELSGQRLMSQLANYLGLVRAKIYQAALTKTYNEHDLDAMQRNTALVFSYWNEYTHKASPEEVSAFDSLGKDANGRYVAPIIQLLQDSARLPLNINPDEWWKRSGEQIDEMLRLQNHLMENTRERTNAIAANEKHELIIYLVLLVIIILLILFILAITIRHISRVLSEIRYAAEALAAGNTDIEVPVYTSDAIGSLSTSVNAVVENSKELVIAAQSIGQGDFSVEVNPRSETDALGMALLKMKEDLSRFTEENQKKLWLQEGLAKVNAGLMGDKDIKSICHDSMQSFAEYVGAQIGIFYTATGDQLDFIEGYGILSEEIVHKHIVFGETLTGEVAISKKIMILENVPEDFIKVATSAGNTLPRHVMILPVIYNGITEGVLEIGSLHAFNKNAEELAAMICPAIAVALYTAKSRARLQELFEQTQAQAEELQAQHSELENINTELEAQTQKLQASEEELKVQQEELMQANQELEERSRLLEEKNQLIGERNIEIQKKAEELEQSTKYKSEFLANMSHELRTPLNSILLLSRLLSENTENNLNEEQVESAKVIQNSGKGLLMLIDEILDLSKIESGKMELEYEHVTVHDITDNMQQLFAPVAKQKNLDLNITLDPALPQKIETDQLRLEQILKNLLSNAFKFTSRGKVSLTVKPSEVNEMMIDFIVKDTGIGIPEQKQQIIFEAFQQADGSTRRKYGGTGLGLSISRELAWLLGGAISVHSETDKGSEFVITIPKVQKSQETTIAETKYVPEPFVTNEQEEQKKFTVDNIPEDVADDRNNIKNNDKVILIVEDDTAFARSLLNYTRRQGYKGIVAVRGDLAVPAAIQYKPAAILLDIQLPVKDGWEIMDELKSNSALRHIPVHMMSSMQAKRESITRGAVDFINKPMALEQMQQVFATLEEALQQGPKKVLIVEENPQHAKALAYFLETFQVNAEVKGSIKESVSALKENGINCVILDMGIPDHNAYETLEQVKKNPGLENLPIIIFTGKNISKAEESRIRQYADSIVVKTAHSYQRILDEVGLFLHLVEDNKSDKDKKIKTNEKLGMLSEVLNNKTVLIADDDVRNIFSLTKALEKHKMKVISAVDGKEALKNLEENPDVDVILMDMMMPEMDGYETTTRIRQNIKYRNIPILAVTAKAMVGDREKCIRAGASDYISKPVDIDQLISLLRVWLYDKNY